MSETEVHYSDSSTIDSETECENLENYSSVTIHPRLRPRKRTKSNITNPLQSISLTENPSCLSGMKGSSRGGKYKKKTPSSRRNNFTYRKAMLGKMLFPLIKKLNNFQKVSENKTTTEEKAGRKRSRKNIARPSSFRKENFIERNGSQCTTQQNSFSTRSYSSQTRFPNVTKYLNNSTGSRAKYRQMSLKKLGLNYKRKAMLSKIVLPILSVKHRVFSHSSTRRKWRRRKHSDSSDSWETKKNYQFRKRWRIKRNSELKGRRKTRQKFSFRNRWYTKENSSSTERTDARENSPSRNRWETRQNSSSAGKWETRQISPSTYKWKTKTRQNSPSTDRSETRQNSLSITRKERKGNSLSTDRSKTRQEFPLTGGWKRKQNFQPAENQEIRPTSSSTSRQNKNEKKTSTKLIKSSLLRLELFRHSSNSSSVPPQKSSINVNSSTASKFQSNCNLDRKNETHSTISHNRTDDHTNNFKISKSESDHNYAEKSETCNTLSCDTTDWNLISSNHQVETETQVKKRTKRKNDVKYHYVENNDNSDSATLSNHSASSETTFILPDNEETEFSSDTL